MTKIKRIEIQFAKMSNRIKQALISNNVDVASLVEQLRVISAVKTKNIPLFDEDVFERVKSISDLWRMLSGYLTIYDYELLEYITEISECKEAQDILEKFLLRIDPSAIVDVDLVLHRKVEHPEGSLKPVLRIKVKAKECTLKIKNMVEAIVSKAYDLKKYTLNCLGIKEGCIELFYCISKPLKVYLTQVKISEDSLKEFLAYKIISLHVDEVELTRIQ